MKRLLGLAVAIVLLLVAFASPQSVQADVTTFNALFFKPDVGRNKFLMLHSVDTLHKYQFQFANYISYGYRPLELRQASTRVTSVINSTIVNDFTAAFGITEYLQLGFDVPLVLFNRFQNPNVTPPPGFIDNTFKMGDILIEGKVRIIDPCRYPVGVAFVPFMTIPTGKDSIYVGDSGLSGGLFVAVEGRVLPQLGIAGNLGFKTGKKVLFRNIEWQHKMMMGLGTYYSWLRKGLTVFGEVNSELSMNALFSNRDLNAAEVMAGVKWDIKKGGKDLGLQISGGAGSCLVCGVKGSIIRGVLGVSYRWMPEKYREADKQDASACEAAFRKMTAQRYYDLRLICPPDPADFKQGVDDDECPKYYDLREIAELLWQCPATEAEFVQGVHDDACPKLYTLMEGFSQDEIWTAYTLAAAEMALRCPSNPANFNPAIHDQSCPKFYDLREIAMLSLVCPDDPAKYVVGKDDAACPKYFDLLQKYPEAQWAVVELLASRDTDKDNINDFFDVCPERKEDYNGFADEDGCPDGGVVAVVGGEIITYRPVYFAFNSSKLSDEDKQVVDLVIGKVNRNPWIKQIRIAGNADARGTDAANQKISERRARVVIDYMRSHGVSHSVRLMPIGYGARRPVAPNTTEMERQRNRRVTFGVEPGRYAPYQRRGSPFPGATGMSRAPTTPPPMTPVSTESTPPATTTSEPRRSTIPSRWD